MTREELLELAEELVETWVDGNRSAVCEALAGLGHFEACFVTAVMASQWPGELDALAATLEFGFGC